MQECLPLVDHWFDLEADFLRFYGIDINQTDTLEAARFFRLAARLAVYEGMLTARIREEQEQDSKKYGSTSGEVREVPLNALATMESDIFEIK